jgi:hypothetical protein
MVASFVSVDFGWFVGLNTGRLARVILKAGKNRDVGAEHWCNFFL